MSISGITLILKQFKEKWKKLPIFKKEFRTREHLGQRQSSWGEHADFTRRLIDFTPMFIFTAILFYIPSFIYKLVKWSKLKHCSEMG